VFTARYGLELKMWFDQSVGFPSDVIGRVVSRWFLIAKFRVLSWKSTRLTCDDPPLTLGQVFSKHSYSPTVTVIPSSLHIHFRLDLHVAIPSRTKERRMGTFQRTISFRNRRALTRNILSKFSFSSKLLRSERQLGKSDFKFQQKLEIFSFCEMSRKDHDPS
jgi:hypothetical protein